MSDPVFSLPAPDQYQLEQLYIKVVGMLQQNWALLASNGSATVCFVDDGANVFDNLHFRDEAHARRSLGRNGFLPFLDPEEGFGNFIQPPGMPKVYKPRPIYSSGQYWRNLP